MLNLSKRGAGRIRTIAEIDIARQLACKYATTHPAVERGFLNGMCRVVDLFFHFGVSGEHTVIHKRFGHDGRNALEVVAGFTL